jgi:ABC-2 type transport system permease protein
MLNLIRAEWLKLTRRPLTWVLLAVWLVLLALQFVAQSLIVFAGQPLLTAAQFEEYRRRATFPGLFGAVFDYINGLGGIFAVVLTAGAIGSEYSWGTLRMHLARYPARAPFLLAKLATLLLLLLVGALITLAVGAVIGWVVGALLGVASAPETHALALLPLALLRALYVLLPYVLLTLCFTVVGRSLLVGVAGGLLYLVFEAGFGTLAVLQLLGGVWERIYNLTIQQNINTLVLLNSHAFGLRPETLSPMNTTQTPSPLQASLIVALYCAAFLATALYSLQRRDITGAA